MTLKEYFKRLKPAERQAKIHDLMVSLDRSESAIRHYINGTRNIRAVHAKRIAIATDNQVTIDKLCPDIYGDVAA